jgi:dihydroorotate dehydrogenase
MSVYKSTLRPIAFRLDPERAHEAIISILYLAQRLGLHSVIKRILAYKDPRLTMELCGLRFNNPVGLSAGFDKNAKLTRIVPALGFGFMEVGTITAQPQSGNPKPRVFRLPADRALINRIGFASEGAEAVSARLKKRCKNTFPLGINIGKTEKVEIKDAARDYLYSFENLFPYSDYFVINVSCPNTPKLQELQDRQPLQNLLKPLILANKRLAADQKVRKKPIFIKICPDRTFEQIDDLLEIIKEQRVDGIIATNTTVDRNHLNTDIAYKEWGGLSGRPLAKKSTEVIKYIYKKTAGNLPIIGVGGISTAQDAYDKIKAGASLIQLYTGMIYEGPAIARSLNKNLLALLQKDKYDRLEDAVGKSV